MSFLICTKCKEEKPEDAFAKQSARPDRNYRASNCKNCYKEYRKRNKEKIQKQNRHYYLTKKDNPEFIETRKNYYKNNIKDLLQYKKQYYQNNKQKQKEVLKRKRKTKEWKEARNAYLRKYSAKKRQTDIVFKLKTNIRRRLHHALKTKNKSNSPIKNLGCTVHELKSYLETRFLPGMTWDNWTREGWHLDHIRPLASFDLTDPEQFKQACHYTNLQPLWATSNLSKGSKWDG